MSNISELCYQLFLLDEDTWAYTEPEVVTLMQRLVAACKAMEEPLMELINIGDEFMAAKKANDILNAISDMPELFPYPKWVIDAGSEYSSEHIAPTVRNLRKRMVSMFPQEALRAEKVLSNNPVDPFEYQGCSQYGDGVQSNGVDWE